MKTHVAYWLVPAGPHRSFFQDCIRELAARFGGPAFTPHVTVYAGPLAAQDAPGAILFHAAPAQNVITLRTTGLAFTAEFTKTLFVEFAPDRSLQDWSAQLKAASAQPAEFTLAPHLSLLYADLPPETKAQIARTLVVPEEITFDRLQAVAMAAQTRSAGDVRAWSLLAERTIGGEPVTKPAG